MRYQDRQQHANARAFFDGKTYCNRIMQVTRSELNIEETDARRALRRKRLKPVHDSLGPVRAQPCWRRRERSSPYAGDRIHATGHNARASCCHISWTDEKFHSSRQSCPPCRREGHPGTRLRRPRALQQPTCPAIVPQLSLSRPNPQSRPVDQEDEYVIDEDMDTTVTSENEDHKSVDAASHRST